MAFDIICCFYSEFNTEKGAEILWQFPGDYIKQEDFLKISEFVIPRTELCDNLVSLRLGNSYLMGYPILLKNHNYDRAKFQFNFCLLISEEEYEKNFLVYELLLKKVAKTFETLEIDADYSFIKNNRSLILSFLENFYDSIVKKQNTISIFLDNINEKCLIEINKTPKESTNTGITYSSSLSNFHFDKFFFFFKFIDFSKAKTEVLPYQVPVWIKYIDFKDLKYFENSVKLIIEQIDGISHVKKIAATLEYEINYVIFVLYNLILVNGVILVDIFQFSNIYRATSNLKKFYQVNLLEEFQNFCKINLSLYNNFSKHKLLKNIYLEEEDIQKENELNESILFSLYCELTNCQDISEFLNKVNNHSVDIALFVAFGLCKKMIRRVHIYGYNKNKDTKDQGSTE